MTFIQTFSGKKFSLIDPQPEDVCIKDIANHLGKLCRFNGASREFYSVAQHSVLVSNLVPVEYRYAALLHDAGEAYYGDITAPLKSLIGPELKAIIRNIDRVIAIAMNIPPITIDVIERADLVALATEKRDLMCPVDFSWVELPIPCIVKIFPVGACHATFDFINRYEESK